MLPILKLFSTAQSSNNVARKGACWTKSHLNKQIQKSEREGTDKAMSDVENILHQWRAWTGRGKTEVDRKTLDMLNLQV